MNFFHHFWDLSKEEVWRIMEESRKSRGVLKAFNVTFLALIHKSEGVYSPGKIRPIALCNVIYKTITNVMENIMKLILMYLVYLEQ